MKELVVLRIAPERVLEERERGAVGGREGVTEQVLASGQEGLVPVEVRPHLRPERLDALAVRAIS